MKQPGFSLFDSPIGHCGMAWGDDGIRAVQLPELTPNQTRARLTERCPELTECEPRGAMKKARDAIVGLLGGRAPDLSKFPLELAGTTDFSQQVYAETRKIARGTTLTYGELAQKIGNPRSVRAVGRALGANPIPIIVPCHRVLAASAGGGGFSAPGGLTTKACLLRIEGLHELKIAGFDYDPLTAATYLHAADQRLARIIDKVGPPKFELRQTSSVFVALTRAIVYQQLSGKAAATILSRVCDLFPRGEAGLSAQSLIVIAHADLRAAGLSENKARALRDLAERTLTGEVPSLRQLKRMDDDAIVDALTAVRGIGRWTVEMLLMFRLGRGDVMAVDDLGLRQGHAIIMGRKDETARKQLAAYAERWRPYRSVASWYLWRAVDLKRGG